MRQQPSSTCSYCQCSSIGIRRSSFTFFPRSSVCRWQMPMSRWCLSSPFRLRSSQFRILLDRPDASKVRVSRRRRRERGCVGAPCCTSSTSVLARVRRLAREPTTRQHRTCSQSAFQTWPFACFGVLSLVLVMEHGPCLHRPEPSHLCAWMSKFDARGRRGNARA